MMRLALAVLLATAAAAQTAPVQGRPRTQFDVWFPRGNLTFAGVVLRIDPDVLTVKTRRDGVRRFVLRRDTFYLGNGMQLDRQSLPNNTCVFIRAGRNLDQDLEAYEIIWGEIVKPVERSH
jgi:hypothetical protein